MRNYLYLIIFLFCSYILPFEIFCQGGSNYSIFGIGDIIQGNSAAYQALGGTQIAVPSNNSINVMNPALWSLVSTTRIQAGYRFNQNIVSGNNDQELWQNNGGLNGFSSLFNFDTTKKISAVLLLQPLSTVNYYMATPISVFNGSDTIRGKNSYKGSGGLSSLTLGLGTKTFDWLYLGASFDVIFGELQHNTYTVFTSDYTTNYTIKQLDDISTIGFKLGMYINPFEPLGIGFSYEYIGNTTIDSKSEYVYPVSLGDVNQPLIDNSKVIRSIETSMPQYLGAGLSYNINNKVMLACDYLLGKYSTMNINKTSNVKFKDLKKISFGISKLGNPNYYAPLKEKFVYKLGAYYEDLYYSINDHDINEIGISAGLQWPLSRTANIDIALVFGQHGTTDFNLLKENFGRLIVDISLGDTWFKKRRR